MILLLSTSDTDLITASASGAAYRVANPSRILVDDVTELADGADLVVIRILGGVRAWEDGLAAATALGKPLVVLSGEQQPDPDLMAVSTVPAGVAAEAHNYLAAGGVENLTNLHNFLSDTVLLTGHGFEPPQQTPGWGVLDRTVTSPVAPLAPTADTPAGTPTIGVLYYRAQHLAGNTRYVDALCSAIEAKGARALPSTAPPCAPPPTS